MAVKVIGLGVVLLGLTAANLRTWASDETLWARAADVNLTSPRPAFNYGLSLRHAGKTDTAALWFMEAVDRAKGTAAEDEYRARVAGQFSAFELYGVFLCDSPSVRPYCSR